MKTLPENHLDSALEALLSVIHQDDYSADRVKTYVACIKLLWQAKATDLAVSAWVVLADGGVMVKIRDPEHIGYVEIYDDGDVLACHVKAKVSCVECTDTDAALKQLLAWRGGGGGE